MPRIDFGNLSREERLLLLRFVCSFAWADSEVRPEERAAVARLVRSLQLDDREARQVDAWLECAPDPASTDPRQVPREHRMAFLFAVQSIVAADVDIAPAEREALRRFMQQSA